MKVTVLYNYPESLESESDADTEKSAREVASGLAECGYEVQLMGISKNSIELISEIKSDVVFNLIEWTGKSYPYGVKAIRRLEKTGIPFTGSDSAGFRLSSDKLIMKKKMMRLNILTPKYEIFETGNEEIQADLSFPVIVKPAYEHCGAGLSQKSVVENTEDLKKIVGEMVEKFSQPVIAEEYIDGREVHVTMLEKAGRPVVLPPAEVVFKNEVGYRKILSYDCKWKEDSWEYQMARIVLAEFPEEVMKKIRNVAIRCYRELGGRDYPRVDMRIRNSEVYVLEINNNPGIDYDTDSGIGFSSRAANITFPELLKHIVEGAMGRWEGKYDTVAS
jgi:D-alanine-D-alanine ligase